MEDGLDRACAARADKMGESPRAIRTLLATAVTAALVWTTPSAAQDVPRTSFSICRTGGGTNCVVDGDTAWIGGVKVRIADVDAPETHPSRCRREAVLGDRATMRLRELLSAGPFRLVRVGRDVDRYGRSLRIAVRGTESIGDQLVREGLARTWEGRRRPWC
jgi:micrococcal nuclease